jgi:hypothetical protein
MYPESYLPFVDRLFVNIQLIHAWWRVTWFSAAGYRESAGAGGRQDLRD